MLDVRFWLQALQFAQRALQDSLDYPVYPDAAFKSSGMMLAAIQMFLQQNVLPYLSLLAATIACNARTG